MGCNAKGALGVGDTETASLPTKIPSLLAPGVSLVGGDVHSCAFRESDSHVWCWGGNERGQIGDGTFKNALKPVLFGL